MTWLPICLFLVLFATILTHPCHTGWKEFTQYSNRSSILESVRTNNAKLESEFINRLPRDVESSSAAPTSKSTEPSSTASTSTEPSSTASTSTEASSTASTSTEPSSTASTSTEPSSTASTSTEPSSTTSSSTEPSSTAPTSTEPSSTKTTPEKEKKDGDECDAESLNNIVCENDKLKFCGPNNKIMSVQCYVKGKQGFCNCEKTGCVAQKPVCPNDKTKCYQPNTKLPDNLDCHKFTYCNENQEKLTLQCPDKLIYDMTLEKCVDPRSAKCHKVVCPRPGKGLQLLPFPQAKNYYVLCISGIGDVRKCPHKYYGVRKDKCEFDCKLRNASGMFQDSNPDMCRKGLYYVCKRSGSNYITIPKNCAPGFTFDEDLQFCTEEDTCKEEEPENN